MCVALPGKVIELDKGDALVDFHGNQVRAKAGLVDVSVGDYVLVHAGFILQKVSTKEAKDLQELMDEVGAWKRYPRTFVRSDFPDLRAGLSGLRDAVSLH